MQNQRKFVRFNAPFLCFLGDRQIQGTVKDVSMGGLRVTFNNLLALDKEKKIDFNLILADKILTISGELIWNKEDPNKSEAGIRFLNIPDSHKEEIYNYILKYHNRELTQRWWQM